MFERILVTGYSGFAGPWVVSELRRHFPRAQICGAARHYCVANSRTAAPDRQIRLDLRDSAQIDSAVASLRPDAVVHLASLKQASLEELLEVNVVGCERLLAQLGTKAPGARIIVVGSSSELGRVCGHDMPLDEDAPCCPVDFYGITKLTQSAIACRQALRGQDVVRLRLFNLIGPDPPDSMLAGRCVRQLRAAAGASGPIELRFGPLETRRDHVDVRDFARAVALALEKSPPGMLYHVGSGTSRSGHDLVNALVGQAGMNNVTYRAAASTDGSLVPWQTADNRRARDELGWLPKISWDHSIQDIWDSTPQSAPLVVVAGTG